MSAPAVPLIQYPADLPIREHVEQIAAAIRDHQVIVLAGETGSGKTTQLPKICLALGRGADKMIGHTQPRRIAARTVAERIASELGEPLGETIGYTVRFHDQVGARTKVKLMTDGILLAEIQRDRELRAYDTIIIDEAHERSLTIDFLLGYLKSLLPRRPDLKLIITSATIDPARFAGHFGDAPVLEVSGRTYPVEVRYRPLEAAPSASEASAGGSRRGAPAAAASDTRRGAPATAASDAEPRDQNTAICDAVRELLRAIDGDILVFLSGEREIRDAAAAVEGMAIPGLDVLPLYGRLSAAEQHRVFNDHAGRRVVLATNVAETSLTVPGIRAVVDVGTARISRYSTRTKVQRLPIEPISQASADQRAGRCGRVAPGICIRLYSEADYDARPQYTEPEILRTNLASVVLQMAALGLGDVARFPFLDPPDQRSVRDAIRLLDELGALDPDSRAAVLSDAGPVALTGLGRSLARLPVDPRLGRMLLAAGDEGCVAELLVIASALSIQDPRERPSDQQDAAAAMHRRFTDPTSDFVGYLNLWAYLREQQTGLSSSAFRRLCRAEFLNYLRVREWQDLHAQLLRVARDLKLQRAAQPAPPANVHRAVLAGLLSHIGLLDEQAQDRPAAQRGANQRGRLPRPRRTRPDYRGARGTRFTLVRDSALASSPPVWVMSGELVETNRLWGRISARIEPEWAEPLAAHLVTRIYSEPRWNARRGAALATERVTLFGLPLVVGRRVNYASIDPEISRELFIRHALVEGDWPTRHPVLLRTREAIERAKEMSRRARRPVVDVDEDALFAFFDQRIPADVVSGRHFETWWKQARRSAPDLLELPDALLSGEAQDADAYPDEWRSDGVALPLTYRFSPGDALDGVVVDVPVSVLNQLPADPAAMPVAGLRDELIIALLRALPKATRRALTPIADTAAAVVQMLDAVPPPTESGRTGEASAPLLEQAGGTSAPLLERLSDAVESLRGVRIPPSSWPLDAVPAHLRATYRVLDDDGSELAHGKDLAVLRESLAPQARQALADAAPEAERAALRGWDFGELPRSVHRTVGSHSIVGYPSLIDEGGSAAVRVLASEQAQRDAMPAGTRRLLSTVVPSPARAVAAALDNRTKLVLAANPHGSVAGLLADCADAAIDAIVAESGGPVWDEAGFARLIDAVRAGLPARAEAAARGAAPVLEQWRVTASALPVRPSAATADAVADMRAQLARLIGPGFVARAGIARLGDLSRYLRAVDRRLEKLPRDPEADHERQLRIEHVQQAYDDALAALSPDAPVPAELADIAWQIEELRVSLFAQELGVRGRVSDTRIYRSLAPYLAA